MRQKPDCLKRSIVAKSDLFTIEQLQLRFSNGVERTYERLKSSTTGSVMIAAITANQSLLLINEYGAGIDDYALGFPKGKIDANETALEAANRELREEVGVAARKLTKLRSLASSPSYSQAKMELIVAQDLYPSPLPGDEPEPIEVVEWPLSNWNELLTRADFTEARSLAALYLVKDWLTTGANHE